MARSKGRSRRSRGRALALVMLWVLLTVAAWLSPPPAPENAGTQGRAESSLGRAFGLPAEPTLLVFHRGGGFTLDDRIYVDGVNRTLSAAAAGVQLHPCTGETQVISMASTPAQVPDLRAGLRDAPGGLTVYVTGAAAFAYDAALVWGRVRPWILAAVAGVAGLIVLLGKLGLRRALVVALSTGSAGTVGSALAALVASLMPVALTTVVSAGLAGAWAVRLLVPQRSAFIARRDPERRSPAIQPGLSTKAVPVTRLQRALVEGGELILVQALIVAAGLAGLVFDRQAGLALLLGLGAAVAVCLSETPALIALLTRPRLPRPVQIKMRLWWGRLALALVLAAGLFGLTWTMHPAEAVMWQSDAATGYALLMTAGEAGQEALKPGRLLPMHLLLQAPGVARSEAGLTALQGLVAELDARPGLTGVGGVNALLPFSETGEGRQVLAERVALLAQAAEMAAGLESELQAQVDALSLVTAELQELDLTDPGATAENERLTSLATVLNETSERLDGVGDELRNASTELARTPVEFPELAPRLDDVPALRALPGTLDVASAELAQIADDLQEITAQVKPGAGSALNTTLQPDPLAPAQASLSRTLASLRTLTGEATRLHADLSAAETFWAGAALGDPAPPAFSPYLASQDLIRLTLIVAGDPYAPAALDEAQTLLQQARGALAGSPLANGELFLTGASVLAAGRREAAWQDRLIPGIVVALMAVLLFTWGTWLRAGQALLLAAGATLSVAAGDGAAVVWGNTSVGAIALVSVVLLALVSGRLAAGPALAVEDLVLALLPLVLILTGVAALVVMGWILSVGLLAGRFLVAPAVVRWSQYIAKG